MMSARAGLGGHGGLPNFRSFRERWWRRGQDSYVRTYGGATGGAAGCVRQRWRRPSPSRVMCGQGVGRACIDVRDHA